MSEQGLRLLALDGGGVRGLSSLQILKQLMEVVDRESPPKPCDYFDMIGGTSTGGFVHRMIRKLRYWADSDSLIAIMLGRLQMTTDECIDAYVSLSDQVFQKQRHRVTVKGHVQGRFDSNELEKAIREIVVEKGLEEDALLQDSRDAKCKVYVRLDDWLQRLKDLLIYADSSARQAKRPVTRFGSLATVPHAVENGYSA